MDGDTEGNGPVGGKFNAKAGTPIAPESDRQTITLSNGATVTINKSVAAQFRGFFNDLIKNGAPVRGLGGFGTRNNPSEHPLGLAIDWAQHPQRLQNIWQIFAKTVVGNDRSHQVVQAINVHDVKIMQPPLAER